MTLLEVRLPPDQLAELADLIAARVQVTQPVPAPASLKLAYTLPEAAEATGMTVWCLRTAIRQGELHAKQAGSRGAYSIPADSLREWLRGTPTPLPTRPKRVTSGSRRPA